MSHIDITGMTFGKWTVLQRTNRKKIVYYVCRCKCGTEREVLSVSLRNGKSVSCGCSISDSKKPNVRREHRATYISWIGMRQRCNYQGHGEYHRYGGRGISYDPRWNDFMEFLSDMGPKPKGKSIDRIDNDKMYCKENCKWSTHIEQSSNTSRNVFVQWDGKTYTLKALSTHLDIEYDLLHKWYRTRGLSLAASVRRALERAPVGSNKLYAPTDQ
jgi:hypothetical protein